MQTESTRQEPENIRAFRLIGKQIDPTKGHTIFEWMPHLTDAGNAERFSYYAKDLARYCEPWKKWLLWDGKRWARDERHKIVRMAKSNIRLLYTQLGMMEDGGDRAEFAKFLAKSESRFSINNSLELAKGEIPILPDELDQKTALLNLENGTYNLETGELEDFVPANFITHLAGTYYDEKACCPTWESFLLRILNGNLDLINFLQKAIGYSLSGDTSEQCLFILHGSGSNGKTTFLRTILALLGTYAKETTTETFMLKRGESVNNDIAALKGARFVSAVETEQGKRLAESLIKQLTGQDLVTARFLFAEFFTYEPQFKIFLGTNHKPTIRGTDHAIWRRIRLIPFDVVIPPEDQDKQLPEKLKQELPGILNWALEGYRQWKAEGLKAPDEVKAAVDGYRAEMDLLSAFFDDRCVIEKAAMVKSSVLYQEYTAWAEENGEYVMSNRKLAGQLQERGFDSYRKEDGIYWIGIGLLAND